LVFNVTHTENVGFFVFIIIKLKLITNKRRIKGKCFTILLNGKGQSLHPHWMSTLFCGGCWKIPNVAYKII